MHAGLGGGVDRFGHVWERLGKDGWVWIGQNDQVGMDCCA